MAVRTQLMGAEVQETAVGGAVGAGRVVLEAAVELRLSPRARAGGQVGAGRRVSLLHLVPGRALGRPGLSDPGQERRRGQGSRTSGSAVGAPAQLVQVHVCIPLGDVDLRPQTDDVTAAGGMTCFGTVIFGCIVKEHLI